MTTALHYFLSFYNKQRELNQKVVKFMSDQDKFNQQILGLIQSLINRVENIEHRLDKLESRINNLIVKNNLKE